MLFGGKDMLFNSIEFLIFFIFVVIMYYVVNYKYRYLILLGASYVFYSFSGLKYLSILLIVTIISYFSGYLINIVKNINYKKGIIFINTFLCLGLLLYFKYLSFILDSMNIIFKSNFSLENIVVPLGISFFILQAITYPIDLYRGHVAVEKNIFKYALFVSFFPQILSGPIGKAKEMLPQFNNAPLFKKKNLFVGAMLMLYGYFQKVVVADLMAFGVNNVYNNLSNFTGIPIFVVVFLYSFQIYFDFVSYSNIALGCAKVLGYDLINNFNSPYFADSIKNFWSRWHISLSTWFKNYLYFPLGGNKKGIVRTYINLLLVFLISGLWHGADITYIIWGLLHGIYQVMERMINRKSKFNVVNVVITFLLVTFAWIFFRADTVSDSFYVIINMFKFNFSGIGSQIMSIGFDYYDLGVLLVSFIFIFIVELVSRKKDLISILYNKSNFIKFIVVMSLVFSIIIFGYYGPGFDNSQFIYLGY